MTVVSVIYKPVETETPGKPRWDLPFAPPWTLLSIFSHIQCLAKEMPYCIHTRGPCNWCYGCRLGSTNCHINFFESSQIIGRYLFVFTAWEGPEILFRFSKLDWILASLLLPILGNTTGSSNPTGDEGAIKSSLGWIGVWRFATRHVSSILAIALPRKILTSDDSPVGSITNIRRSRLCSCHRVSVSILNFD